MNNCGADAEKFCRFVSTRFFDFAQNDSFFVAPNLFGAFLLTLCVT